MLDRGDIATGGGADGEGELVPPPCLLRSKYLTSPASPTPPAPAAKEAHAIRWHPYSAGFSAGVPILFCRHPPPHPRLRRSSPAPSRGAGSVPGRISGEQPCPGWSRRETVSGVEPVGRRARLFSRISPCAGPWGYRHWGEGPTGRGNEFPLPCLPDSNHLASRRSHPSLWQGIPGYLTGSPTSPAHSRQ